MVVTEANFKKLYEQSRTENIKLRQTVEQMREELEERDRTIEERDGNWTNSDKVGILTICGQLLIQSVYNQSVIVQN